VLKDCKCTARRAVFHLACSQFLFKTREVHVRPCFCWSLVSYLVYVSYNLPTTFWVVLY
jgi:hypothetical protein